MGLLTQIDGWTPVIDALAKEHGLITAAVFGAVWRYCQMEDRVCRASLEVIGDRLNLDKGTTLRHIKKLCKEGYLKDLTPTRRNAPHVYADTGKIKITGSIQATPGLESHTKRGQTVADDNSYIMKEGESVVQNNSSIPPNPQTVAQNNATVAQNNATVAEKQLKRLSKRLSKKELAAEFSAAPQFEDLLPASPTNGRKPEHDSLLAQIQNGGTEQANQARLIALGLAAKEQAPITGLEQIELANWRIKDDRTRQGMAIFLEAVPLGVPVSRSERGQWQKGIKDHLEEFGLTGLKELYRTAWNEYLPDITAGKLDITHPLALTRKMRGIRSRPQPTTQEAKYFIDPDTGERIKW